MPQAIPAVAAWAAQGAIQAAIVNFVTGALINLALGALQFTDDEGEIWIAVDE